MSLFCHLSAFNVRNLHLFKFFIVQNFETDYIKIEIVHLIISENYDKNLL